MELLQAVATFLTTDPTKTVFAFVLGATFNAGLAELIAGRHDRRARKRESEDRLREWNRERIRETRRFTLAWIDWLAHRARGGSGEFDLSEFPSANMVLTGDAGAVLILDSLPLDLQRPIDKSFGDIVRLRHGLMHILDQQERRAVQDRPLLAEMSAAFGQQLATLEPFVRRPV